MAVLVVDTLELGGVERDVFGLEHLARALDPEWRPNSVQDGAPLLAEVYRGARDGGDGSDGDEMFHTGGVEDFGEGDGEIFVTDRVLQPYVNASDSNCLRETIIS